jgi:hypothetical protein
MTSGCARSPQRLQILLASQAERCQHGREIRARSLRLNAPRFRSQWLEQTADITLRNLKLPAKQFGCDSFEYVFMRCPRAAAGPGLNK